MRERERERDFKDFKNSEKNTNAILFNCELGITKQMVWYGSDIDINGKSQCP